VKLKEKASARFGRNDSLGVGPQRKATQLENRLNWQ
jgi:hypothetical protein